jgi:hypothetical protein
MPLTAAPGFSPPQDLHVLRGQGAVQLGQLLHVNWLDDSGSATSGSYSQYRQGHTDVEMVFQPIFNFAMSVDFNTFLGFGIELDRATGELRVGAWPSTSPAPACFMVEAKVARNGTGGPQFEPAPLRIHVHRSIDRIWLTPHRLSIRFPPASEFADHGFAETNYAFTVRARFDDATTGDFTFSDQLQMLPADHFNVQPGRVQRIRILSTASAGDTIAITASTSAAWGSHSDGGEINLLPAWETNPQIPRAELIAGHPDVLDGTKPPDDLPNVLFVSCGFTSADAVAFETITELIVARLGNDPMLQPFPYLSSSINYWRLMLPAREAGLSVRCGVYPFWRDGSLYASPVPSPKPLLASGPWTLQNLIYRAGLPIPSDLQLVIDKVTNLPLDSVETLGQRSAAQLDFSALSQKWNAIIDPAPARDLSTEVAKQWLALAARTFIDEVDTFPGTALGVPPAANEEEEGLLSYHQFRGDWMELHEVFKRMVGTGRGGAPPIVLGAGPPHREVGVLWRDHTFAFINADLVVALSNIPFGRELNASFAGIHVRPHLVSQLQTGGVPGLPVQTIADRGALALLPPPSTRILLPDTWRTVAHELGHSFGLGDEYAEFPKVFPEKEADLDTYANLTTTGAVLNADGSARIVDIKWNWDRIDAARVMTAINRIGTSTQFEIEVPPTRQPAFHQGETVFIRKREKGKVINRAPVTSAPYQITSVTDAGARIVVAPTQANTDLAGFVVGDVLYRRVPGQSSGHQLRLVSPAAERILLTLKTTMTGLTCDVTAQAANGGGFTQVPQKSDPMGHVSAKDLPGLVGVYFGGARHSCGILHPVGRCMMRNSYQDVWHPKIIPAPFCPVCRYVLVEQIDPNKHGIIDRDYDKEYPL